jgi:hypothetical protein
MSGLDALLVLAIAGVIAAIVTAAFYLAPR